MKAALYARVSTTDKDQNPELQLDGLRKYCKEMGWELYQEYIDEASAVDLVRRKAWTQLMKHASLRKFDVLLVWKIDRAFRSVIHAANTLSILRSYRVGFRSFMEPTLDTTTPHGEFIFNILAAVAELERETIRQRVQAGMDHAKEHGTRSGNRIGRPRKDIDFNKVCKALKDADGNYSGAARLLIKETGIKVTPGFVQMRIQRGIEESGATVPDIMEGEKRK